MRHPGFLNDSVENWGSEQLDLYYAGCHLAMTGLSTRQQHNLCERYSRQLTPASAAPTVRVEARAGCGPIPDDDPARFTSNGIYMPVIEQTQDSITVAGEHFRAHLQLAPTLTGHLTSAVEWRLTQPAVFENFLRVAAAYTSLAQQGLFMHCAGIIFDGCAWLFLGRSGAGKSTLSRRALDSGLGIFSDDCNILRPLQGVYQVSPVPFAGDLGDVAERSGLSYPLRGMFWLQQSSQLGLESLGPGLQLAKLLACCPVVNVDPHRLEALTQVADRLLASAPLQVLHFRRDESFDAVRQLLRESARACA